MSTQNFKDWFKMNYTPDAMGDRKAEIAKGNLPSDRMSIKTGAKMLWARDVDAAFDSYKKASDQISTGYFNGQFSGSSRQSLQKQLELCLDFSNNIKTWCQFNLKALRDLEVAIDEAKRANTLENFDANIKKIFDSYTQLISKTINILMRQNAAFEGLAQSIQESIKNLQRGLPPTPPTP